MVGLLAAAALSAGPAAQAAAPAPRAITDPQAFVTGVYKRLAADPNYAPPTDIYTPRLKALWADMTRDARGEVGRVDFEFWTNAQDWALKGVVVTSKPVEGNAGRRVVIARFTNSGAPEEIRFYFERTAAGWRLDDARSVGKDGWTLSLILKYGWDGE